MQDFGSCDSVDTRRNIRVGGLQHPYEIETPIHHRAHRAGDRSFLFVVVRRLAHPGRRFGHTEINGARAPAAPAAMEEDDW